MTLLSGILPAAEAETPAPRWGDMGDGTYRNPILWMDYNNPCVIRAGDTFYLTSATHHFMGMPILKSRDLVNWTHAGRIYERLGGLHEDFQHPGKAYSAGSQDGEIGFHNGTYFLYNWSTKYGGFYATAPSPEGPWTEPKPLTSESREKLEDPCPFWDDDGKGYLLLVGNPGPLRIFPLNEKGDGITGEGTVLISDIPPKGPQIFKRDGYYYLLVARTGPHKAQFAYRSKNLFGPYEGRMIFEGKAFGIQAAQGSMVHVQGDEWAFLHHDYDMSSVYGRRIYLQPAGWGKDGWPWIGVDPDGDGVGEPVGIRSAHKKPTLPADPINAADPSDEFDAPHLGGQWAWNHDPIERLWSLTERPGWLRLKARPLNREGGRSQYPPVEVPFREDHLLFAYNTPVQRLAGESGTVDVLMDTAGMADGQRAGLCTMIDDYTWIGVAKDGGKKTIRFAKGDPKGPGGTVDGPELTQDLIWLRLEHQAAKGTLSYSLDGRTFTPLGDRDYAYSSFWYEGTKAGVFSYNLSTSPEQGRADFDFVRQQHDGPRSAE